MISFKNVLVAIVVAVIPDHVLAFSSRSFPGLVGLHRGGVLYDRVVRFEDSSVESDPTGRRGILSKLVSASLWTASGAALGFGGLGGAGLPAWADVSDGNALPEGAAQFGRVIRAKADLLVRWLCLVEHCS
jgi:hypothetical protein